MRTAPRLKVARELALIAACCRWPSSDAREAAVCAAASEQIDWPRLDRVAARHRVTPLVHDGLTRAGVAVPETTRHALANRAARAAADALHRAGETLRIQTAFDTAGLPLLVIKSSAIAQLAYGDLGIKESWDIDILTTPGDAVAGARLLERLGYTIPTAGPDKDFARFVGLSRECEFHHPAHGTTVELHWGLADNPRLLPGLDAHAPAQAVPLGEGALRTFEDGALFAYLSVHGSVHGWFRLKWLADVAAFLATRDIAALYRSAESFGAGRTAGTALLLSADLLGLRAPPALLAALRNDRAITALYATAITSLAYEGEFAPFSLPALRIRLSQFRLAPGRNYLAAELALCWTSPADRMAIRLPRSLDFAYHLLRVPLWLSRRLRSAG